MAVLQLLIVRNYSRSIIGFLRVNCIFGRFFWQWTRPNPTHTRWRILCRNPTRPNQTHGWTRPVSNSEPYCCIFSLLPPPRHTSNLGYLQSVSIGAVAVSKVTRVRSAVFRPWHRPVHNRFATRLLSITRCSKSRRNIRSPVCQVAAVVMETTQLVLSQLKNLLTCSQLRTE